MTTRHCFALDLKNDSDLINEYKRLHQPNMVWAEIIDSIKVAGIETLDIYLVGNRLFMVMDVNDQFCFSRKQSMDNSNLKVVEWETLMWKFQQRLPWAEPGEKWLPMEKIFTL